jgi:hypothetical protein
MQEEVCLYLATNAKNTVFIVVWQPDFFDVDFRFQMYANGSLPDDLIPSASSGQIVK